MCEPGDPPIWKSTITILSPWNPYGVDVDVLAREALMGDCFLLSKVSEPAVPDEIAAAGDFFFPEAYSGNDYGEIEEEEPSWIDRHSVNCHFCDRLYDDRESVAWLKDGGEVCPDCRGRVSSQNLREE
jgi:hypothetical protein